MRPYLPQVISLGVTEPPVEIDHGCNLALFLLHPYEVLHSEISTRDMRVSICTQIGKRSYRSVMALLGLQVVFDFCEVANPDGWCDVEGPGVG